MKEKQIQCGGFLLYRQIAGVRVYETIDGRRHYQYRCSKCLTSGENDGRAQICRLATAEGIEVKRASRPVSFVLRTELISIDPGRDNTATRVLKATSQDAWNAVSRKRVRSFLENPQLMEEFFKID